MKNRKLENQIRAAVLAAAIVVMVGLTALRAQSSFIFYGPISRIITPGAGVDDLAYFCFENPADSGVSGKIYSLTGAHVSGMSGPNPVNGTYGLSCPQPAGGFNYQYMTWDGTMNGRYVTSGVYLYEIMVGGRSYTGTIVVAR